MGLKEFSTWPTKLSSTQTVAGGIVYRAYFGYYGILSYGSLLVIFIGFAGVAIWSQLCFRTATKSSFSSFQGLPLVVFFELNKILTD